MSDWGHPDVQQWKKDARLLQQTLYLLLGDRKWDIIEKGEWCIFRRKVGYGIYGAPSMEPNESNRYIGYEDEQLKHIEEICDKLCEHNDDVRKSDIYFACIFVTGKIWDNRFTIPVFRTKKRNGPVSFVDTDCRVYSSWKNYLNENQLPKCMYCYPRDGYYSGDEDNDVEVDFGTSPACDLVNRFFRGVNTVVKIVAVGATGVALVGLCSTAVPAFLTEIATSAQAVCSLHSAGQSGYCLMDRATHGQNIGISDEKAHCYWLSIAGCTLAFTQGRMSSYIESSARAGIILGSMGRFAFVAVNTTNLVVKAYGIIYAIACLADRLDNGEDLSDLKLELFQLGASMIFFANNEIIAGAVEAIIRGIQRDMAAVRLGRRPWRNPPNRNARGTGDVNPSGQIDNLDDLYSFLADSGSSNSFIGL